MVNAETYVKLVQELSCVKWLILNIPRSFVEGGNISNTFKELPYVQGLSFDSEAGTNLHTLVERCCSMMPNLRSLRFMKFCGVWVQQKGEFQLTLPAFSLERLTIYTTYITQMIKRLKKRNIEEGDFLVIVVETLESGERFLFKLSPHNSSTTCINDKDLKGYVRGVDYFRVHITVKGLQKLIVMRLNRNTKSWYPVTLDLVE